MPGTYTLVNTYLDREKAFLHRTTPGLEMEPEIAGQRLRIRSSIKISAQQFETNKTRLGQLVKAGVVEVTDPTGVVWHWNQKAGVITSPNAPTYVPLPTEVVINVAAVEKLELPQAEPEPAPEPEVQAPEVSAASEETPDPPEITGPGPAVENLAEQGAPAGYEPPRKKRR